MFRFTAKFFALSATLIISGLFLGGCQSGLSAQSQSALVISDTDHVITREAIAGKSPLASYLVARQAINDNNVPLAAEEFAASLAGEPNNIRLMHLAFSSFYMNGDVDNAAILAGQMEQQGRNITFGSEPALILAIEARDYSGMAVIADHIAADELTRPLGIVTGAWALIFQGQGDAGLTRILELKAEDDEVTPFIVFSQAAMMNEYLGRPQDAVAAARLTIDHPQVNVAIKVNMAGILARQGYMDEARDILDSNLSQIFNKKDILASLTDGTSTLLIRPDMNDLLAEAILEASSMRRDGHISSSARLLLASRLAPENDRINYAVGLYYQDLEDYENAHAYFDRIALNSHWHQPGLVIKARTLSLEGQDQIKARNIFTALSEANPQSSTLWQQNADAARRRGDLDNALLAYDNAIALNPDKARLHYARAIVLDNLDRKEETEAGLRRSLELNPEDAYALNYLGYWLLEEGGDAEEALAFIRKAIAQQPQNGYFMDSLGWGYFKLGQYRQAVLYLERAVSLEPQDPIITDHLGDAYAYIGRLREARFQWERALLFDPEAELITQIKTKLKDEIIPK